MKCVDSLPDLPDIDEPVRNTDGTYTVNANQIDHFFAVVYEYLSTVKARCIDG